MRHFQLIAFAAIILLAAAVGLFLSRQDFSRFFPQPQSNASTYRPASGTPTTLVYVLTPGAEPGEVKGMISAWKPLAEKFNVMVVVPPTWTPDNILSDIVQLRRDYQLSRVFISGFSNGGYNACRFGLNHPDMVSGIIALGAFCDPLDSDHLKKPTHMPILVVAGEQDTWARGEDLNQIQAAIERFQPYGIAPEVYIVPGIGHTFPTAALDKIGDWIQQQRSE